MRAKALGHRQAGADQGLGVGEGGGRGEGELAGLAAAGLVDDAARGQEQLRLADRSRPGARRRWPRRSGAPRSGRGWRRPRRRRSSGSRWKRSSALGRGLGRRRPASRRPGARGSRRPGRPGANSRITPSSARARSSAEPTATPALPVGSMRTRRPRLRRRAGRPGSRRWRGRGRDGR